MSQNIVMHPEQPVNTRRFVPAKAEATEQDEYAQGRRLYYHGKPLAACLTDEQARGYLDAEARCEAQYWAGMVQQASNAEVM